MSKKTAEYVIICIVGTIIGWFLGGWAGSSFATAQLKPFAGSGDSVGDGFLIAGDVVMGYVAGAILGLVLSLTFVRIYEKNAQS